MIVAAFVFKLAPFEAWQLWLIPVGLYVAFIVGTLVHNTTHDSMRPKWINRVVGELCGFLLMMGFPGWAITHLIHHQYPDDPERDVHPPLDLSYWQFLDHMGATMARLMTKNYFDIWGTAPKYKRIWKGVQVSAPFVRYARVLFLFLLLGPSWFIFLYMPLKLLAVFMYAHFNYFTHRPLGKNQFEILNLNEGISYKLLNLVTFGSYFHKNHHKNPSLFDPRKLKTANDEPMISWEKGKGKGKRGQVTSYKLRESTRLEGKRLDHGGIRFKKSHAARY